MTMQRFFEKKRKSAVFYLGAIGMPVGGSLLKF